MRCPECKGKGLRVKETRSTAKNRIRRRRDCPSCKHVFTTYEQIEAPAPRGRPPDLCYPVKRLDTGEVFSSCAEAARKCRISYSSIYRVLTGAIPEVYGIRWGYVRDP